MSTAPGPHEAAGRVSHSSLKRVFPVTSQSDDAAGDRSRPSGKGRELLSVVVPAYEEEDNVEQLHSRLSDALAACDIDWELIFSVDPCTDRTEERIRDLIAQDERVRMLCLSRRFGQPVTTLVGLEASAGDAAVVMDWDLQEPAELITQLLGRGRDGYDVVYAHRRTRTGKTLPKRLVASLGYPVIKRIAQVPIPPNTGDFRLMSRRVATRVVCPYRSCGRPSTRSAMARPASEERSPKRVAITARGFFKPRPCSRCKFGTGASRQRAATVPRAAITFEPGGTTPA